MQSVYIGDPKKPSQQPALKQTVGSVYMPTGPSRPSATPAAGAQSIYAPQGLYKPPPSGAPAASVYMPEGRQTPTQSPQATQSVYAPEGPYKPPPSGTPAASVYAPEAPYKPPPSGAPVASVYMLEGRPTTPTPSPSAGGAQSMYQPEPPGPSKPAVADSVYAPTSGPQTIEKTHKASNGQPPTAPPIQPTVGSWAGRLVGCCAFGMFDFPARTIP